MTVDVRKRDLSFQEAMRLLRDPEHWSYCMGFEGGPVQYQVHHDDGDCRVVPTMKRRATAEEKNARIWWVRGPVMEDGDEDDEFCRTMSGGWSFVRQ